MNKTNEAEKLPRKEFRPGTRRLIQLYSALLYNAHLKGFLKGEIYQGGTKAVCVPGFNCYSCPGAAFACPLGALQNAFAASGHRAGWYVAGIILLYGVILGRTICGFVCPLGLLQELLHKIPTLKIRKSRITRALSYVKYLVLAVFVIAVPLCYGLAHDLPLPGFCKYICPAGTFEGAMGMLPASPEYLGMLGLLFTRKFIIMLVTALACIFIYRSFCRFLCPLGAIYGLFNRFSIVGVKVDADRCNHCGACVRSCRMDVKCVGDHECMNCGKCMEVCRRGAISIKAGKYTLKTPAYGMDKETEKVSKSRRRTGRISWGIALAVLCFALLWYNVLDQPASADASVSASKDISAQNGKETVSENIEETPAEKTEETSEKAVENAENKSALYVSDASVGYEVGDQLQDFTVQCYDGSEFHLAETRGKVTVINLWATYCAPCIQELPYFSALYQEHEGDIAVLAVHSPLVAKDSPEAFISDKEYAMPFATDTADVDIFGIVGGSATLPQTIVLNRRGEVIYNQVKSVTPEMLEELYMKAGQS